MYRDNMLSVGKIENGFIIELRVPFKPKEKDDDSPTCCGFERNEKEIFASDAADLGKKIEALIPLLDVEFSSESDFDAAFKVAKV